MSQYFFHLPSDLQLTGTAFKNWTLKIQILSALVDEGEATLPEISKMVQLSIPKVTDLVNELIQQNLVVNLGKKPLGNGRRPAVFGLYAGSAFFIGIQVYHNMVLIGLIDFQKNIVSIKKKHPFELQNNIESLDRVCEFINEFVEKQKVDKKKIQGIGLSLTGRINSFTGYSYSYFNFSESPLSDYIQNKTKLKVHIENDARSQAFGEYMLWKNEYKNVLYLYLDYGIGMGVIIDGKLHYGKSGFSGEIGHVPFFDNEILCKNCGKKGCVESECSGWALLSSFQQSIAEGFASHILSGGKKPEDVSMEDIVQGAINNDTLCIDLIAKIGFKLGKVIAVLINIFNPELIILGGKLSHANENLLYPIKSAINKYALHLVHNDTKLVIEKQSKESGVYGVALLALNRFLSVENH